MSRVTALNRYIAQPFNVRQALAFSKAVSASKFSVFVAFSVPQPSLKINRFAITAKNTGQLNFTWSTASFELHHRGVNGSVEVLAKYIFPAITQGVHVLSYVFSPGLTASAKLDGGAPSILDYPADPINSLAVPGYTELQSTDFINTLSDVTIHELLHFGNPIQESRVVDVTNYLQCKWNGPGPNAGNNFCRPAWAVE